MAYHDIVYIFAFLPVSLIIYQLFNKKIRYIALLMFSCVFFVLFSRIGIIYPFVTAGIIYAITNILAKQQLKCDEEVKAIGRDREKKKQIKERYTKKKRKVLVLGIVLVLAILVVLKYYNFFADSINYVVSRGDEKTIPTIKLLVPLGISFYTMQAIGYMVDVYWGKVNAEKNILKLALFLTFFPTVMEGPIVSYIDVKDSLFSGEGLRSENLVDGSIRIVWGLFKKVVVADRLYVIVATLFDGEESYKGAYIVFAAIAYTIQLYMEFSGCMDIVIGTGKMFGIKLTENFRQPFLSKNASEFWRRWHISLGIWFKTYIFYPVSMSGMAKKWNQFGKQKLSKYVTMLVMSAMALFPVWLCNGLWHGPRWNYIFYGMYYFVIIMLELVFEPVRKSIEKLLKVNEDSKLWNLVLMLKTWVIIFTGELFFRANTLKQGFTMFFALFKDFKLKTFFDGSIYTLGLSKPDFIAAVVGAIIVFAIGLIREKNDNILETIRNKKVYIRWAIYICLILSVIIFGAYGPGYLEVDLIYAGF